MMMRPRPCFIPCSGIERRRGRDQDRDMKQTNTQRLDISADRVWAILGTDFGNVGQWARGLARSRLVSSDGRLAPGTQRICALPDGNSVTEVIEEYDPEQRIIHYALIQGAPIWLRRASNRWQVRPLGGEGCAVRSTAELVLPCWLVALTPLVRLYLRFLFKRFVEDLRREVGKNV